MFSAQREFHFSILPQAHAKAGYRNPIIPEAILPPHARHTLKIQRAVTSFLKENGFSLHSATHVLAGRPSPGLYFAAYKPEKTSDHVLVISAIHAGMTKQGFPRYKATAVLASDWTKPKELESLLAKHVRLLKFHLCAHEFRTRLD